MRRLRRARRLWPGATISISLLLTAQAGLAQPGSTQSGSTQSGSTQSGSTQSGTPPPGFTESGEPDLAALDLRTLMEMDVTVVTAQRRSENVTAVPISMAVVKADTIQGLNLATSQTLQAVVPGLTTSNNVGFMLPYLRGAGTDVSSSGIDPSVAVYVDGVYQADRILALTALHDVQQVEVLKGPQGTLYGRNATGGAINITTYRPTDRFEASMTADYGNLERRGGNLFVAGPLSERVRVSLAGAALSKDGYYRNLFNGADVNGEQFYSLHGRTELDLSTTLQAEASLKYFSRNDDGTYGTQLDANSLQSILGIPQATRPYQTFSNYTDTQNHLDSTTTSVKLRWNNELLRVQSLTSHNQLTHRFAIDSDLSPVTLVHLRNHEYNRAFSQEFQFTPPQPSGSLDWLFGAFYLDGAGGFRPAQVDTIDRFGTPLTVFSTSQVSTRAYAAFGEATQQLGGGWSATAGLRYSHERKQLSDGAFGIVGALEVPTPDVAESWDDTTYRAVLRYSGEHAMVYAKTETGFKSGALNNANLLEPGPVDPEQITAYEIGLKRDVARLPLRVSLAGFYNDYRDLQIQVQETEIIATRIEQAPRAETYGIDANLEWRLGRHWDVIAGVSWLRAVYRDYTSDDLLVPSPLGGSLKVAGLDVSGKQLSRSPELTASLLGNFSYPLRSGELFGTANYYRSSRVFFEPSNSFSQPGFDLFNAGIGYRAASGWSLSAWGRNLGNEVYLDAILPGVLGAFGQYAEPRTYGVTLGYSFGK